MRKFTQAKTKKEAEENIGRDWVKLAKVDGGYLAFDSLTDYKSWKEGK